MQAVIVIHAAESGEELLLFVHAGIEAGVVIDVGVEEQVRRAGDEDAVAHDGDAEGGDEVLILDEDGGGVARPSLVVSSRITMRSTLGCHRESFRSSLILR